VEVGESKEVDKAGRAGPIFISSVFSLNHDPKGCCLRRSSTQTKEESLVLRWCISQEACCDKGRQPSNSSYSSSG
jgi:hypothetical protein